MNNIEVKNNVTFSMMVDRLSGYLDATEFDRENKTKLLQEMQKMQKVQVDDAAGVQQTVNKLCLYIKRLTKVSADQEKFCKEHRESIVLDLGKLPSPDLLTKREEEFLLFRSEIKQEIKELSKNNNDNLEKLGTSLKNDIKEIGQKQVKLMVRVASIGGAMTIFGTIIFMLLKS